MSDTSRLTSEQALLLIEEIAALGELDYAFKNEDAARRFGRIYAAAHSTLNTCKNPHAQEAEAALSAYDSLAEDGEVPPRSVTLKPEEA
jgi:hypothetical protein